MSLEPREEGGLTDDTTGDQQRVVRDTLLPTLVGTCMGAAVGGVLAASRVADADLVLLIGGGAAIGAAGGILLTAARALRLRPPADSDRPS